ncbi:MAG: hypothetical protein ACRD80_07290, partial [Nitrososphaeraceae archaeon]
MRTNITLIVGLSTVFLFLSISGTPYVNGQSSTLNSSSVDNDTSSTNSKTENLDPFVLKGSSNTENTGNSNDPAQADDGSSTNSNNDDASTANDGSSADSNSDSDGSSADSNSDSDGSSADSNNDSDGSSANSN